MLINVEILGGTFLEIFGHTSALLQNATTQISYTLRDETGSIMKCKSIGVSGTVDFAAIHFFLVARWHPT